MKNIFEKIFKILIIILPFHVLISVFFQYKIWIWGFSIYKEILILILLFSLAYEYFKLKIKPKFDKLDYLIFGYIWYLIFISILNNTWLKAILYWWRYDFEFLLVFLLIRHWSFLLDKKLSYYIKLFLYSSWLAILIWIVIRFIIWENVLLYFGFSPRLSNWNFEIWVPIYHWIEWANVRRFQWIFDWPNQAAFFLITFAGIFYHYLRWKKEYSLYLWLVIVIVLWLVFMTYSRSSLLWIIWSLSLIFILNIGKIFRKYIKQFLSILLFIFLLWWVFYIRYSWHMQDIILRSWSSKWHSERMIIWFNQFKSNPLGSWLASSGPGYRFTHDITNTDEKYFIPESWYIQQLVEWWIIGFILFMAIILTIAYMIYPISIWLFFSFMAILAMNVFLHTFEASYISIILFLFLGLFLRKKDIIKSN